MKLPPIGYFLVVGLWAFMYFYGGFWWLVASLTIFGLQCLHAAAIHVGLVGKHPRGHSR